jgi:hypothetical protein
LSQ